MRRYVISAGLVAILGVGCGGGSGKSTSPATNAAPSATKGASGGGDSKSAAAGPTTVLASVPLATAKAPNVRVEINDLRHTSSDVVTLTFTLINDGTGAVDREFAFSNQDDYNSFNLLYLLDEAGQKKYLTLQDSKKDCICSRNLTDDSPGVAAGTRAQYFAKFPAPPDTVTAMQVVFPEAVPTKVPVAK